MAAVAAEKGILLLRSRGMAAVVEEGSLLLKGLLLLVLLDEDGFEQHQQ